LKTGAALAPFWVLILNAAESWGMPPWELAGGSKLKWLMRYKIMTTERNRKDK